MPLLDLDIHSLEELTAFGLPVVMSPSVLHYAEVEAEDRPWDAALATVLKRATKTKVYMIKITIL